MATKQQKAQFLVGIIMYSFGVNEGKGRPELEILEKLYELANLTNNKALVQRLDKGRCISGLITDSIYEDIAYIVAEKIVEDKTGVLQEAYKNLFCDKYFDVQRAIERTKTADDIMKNSRKLKNQQYMFAYFACVLMERDLDEIPYLRMIAEQSDYFQWIFIDDNESVKHIMVLEDGSNIVDNGAFEKYKTRRIAEICEYLKIKEKDFKRYLVQEMQVIDSESGIKTTNKNGSFEHQMCSRIIANHKGGASWLSSLYAMYRMGRRGKPYEPDVDSVIDAYFTALFLKYHADEKLADNRVSMMRDYKADSPETDWLGLCNAYQTDRLVEILTSLQRKYYENFSWEHIAHKDVVAKYDRIVSELNEASEKQAEKIKELLNDISAVRGREQSASDKNYIAYEQKIHQLEKQLEEKEEEIIKAKEQLADRDSYIDLLEKPDAEEADTATEIDYESLSKRKILFVGGLPETVNKVMSNFAFKKHIGKEYAGTIDVSAVQDIVIFYDFLNHALYYKVINVAREHKINVIYCHGRNADNILAHIAKHLSEE